MSMNKVFNIYPWIMPPEPEVIQEFFVREGRLKKISKGQLIAHGALSGQVSLIVSGLVIFYFLDYMDQQKVFSICPPKRTVGDLEVVGSMTCNALAECYYPGELLIVTNQKFQDFLRSSVDVMEQYALSSNLKHQCAMEGMISNYTLPLSLRLKLLLYSTICTQGKLEPDGWNEIPFKLTVTDISLIISANRSWLSTTLNKWIADGFVKKDRHRLLVHGKLFEELGGER